MPDITISRDCHACGGDGYVSEPHRVGNRTSYECRYCAGTGKIRTTHKQAIVKEVKRAYEKPHFNIYLFDRSTGIYLESADRPTTDHEALLKLAQRINAGT
jgi:hypothetical protein